MSNMLKSRRVPSGWRALSAKLGLVLAVLLFSLSAAAQTLDQVKQVFQPFSANSQATMAQLTTLNELAADEWRIHPGDLPHGESPDLDDSSWQVVKPGTMVSKDSVWFRRWIEVPKDLHGYDLTGARIWFAFSASANGPMPEIYYFNGRRVALGDDLEPVVLFENAKPGDKVLVAVKLLHTVDDKNYHGTELRIDVGAGRPNPKDIWMECLNSALLIPTLSKNPESDLATLEGAITEIDFSALKNKDQARFDRSLRAAQQKLEQLRPLTQQANVHMVGNSHIDAAWLWPWTETVDVVKRTFSSALQLMDEYPDYTYAQSAAQYSAWMAEKYPQIHEQIKRRVKEGRWEIVGGMWVEPDLNMPDGETQVRQLLLGKRWFQKEYGVDVRIGWNPDSFGYTWQLPQIYKKSGIDYFVTQKMAWNDTNKLPFKLFWWESPDGSKVLTYFPADYANDNLNPVRHSYNFMLARQNIPNMTEMMDLFGVGDHGGGPTRAILGEGLHWMEPGKVAAHMKFGTAQSYFNGIEGNLIPDSRVWDYDSIAKGFTPPSAPEGKLAIPTWKSELYFEYHRGVMTTQAKHKQSMRDSEEWTLNAEKFASLAWLQGMPYPADELTDAWKKITFNTFHDSAAGSGIATIYKEAQQDYEHVKLATGAISQSAIKTLAADVDTHVASGVPVLVFNPLAWKRSGAVMIDVQLPSAPKNGVAVLDAANHVLPSQVVSADKPTHSYKLLVVIKDVPSMGYKLLRVDAESKPFAHDLQVEGLTLENSAIKVTVDKQTGCITSLYDKRSKFESIANGGCGNQLQAFKDLPKEYDAWNIDPGTLDHFTPIDRADSVELLGKGPVRSAIRVTRTWNSSKFVQEIVLDADSDHVDVVNDIDWHETHVLLKAAFPLAASSNKATYEIPYGTIQRPTTRNNSWEQAQFEVPVLRWADLGDGQHGFSLLNNSKYGYDTKDNVMRISLLRSPTWPDPEADRGRQHITFALYPHAGDWKQSLTVRRGYEYNYPLQAVQVAPHAGELPGEHSFVTVEPENVLLTALKKAEDTNALVFRVYEWAGKSGDVTFQVPKGAQGATIVNLMEKSEGSALKLAGETVTAPIHPYEILTVQVNYAKGQ
jgi:alpha-mannosidase